MTHKEVRDKFIELSGRYDLVNEDGTDNGADFFIHKGQRILDRHHYHQKGTARVFKKVAAGDHGVVFEDCRAVTEVWVANDEGRVRMEKKTHNWLRENYTSTYYSGLDQGCPYYYAVGLFRIHPSLEVMPMGDMAIIMGYLDAPMTGGYKYNGIIFLPPSDGEYMIEVIGYFYSPQLTGDTDENFWTSTHPEILIKSALYQLEGFYRNTEGLKDASLFLLSDMAELDKDQVEEEMADIDQEMEEDIT